MYNRKFILIITIVLIISLLFSSTVIAIDNSFSSLFGGSSYGKEALSFITVMSGLGVAFVTNSDALNLYNDIKDNAPALLSSMVYVVKQSWLGHYSNLSDDITAIKQSVYDYLINNFGTLQVGINQSSSNPVFTLSNVGDNAIYSTGPFSYNLVNIKNVNFSPRWNIDSSGTQSRFDAGTIVKVSIISIVTGTLTFQVSYYLGGDLYNYQYTHSVDSSLVLDTPTSSTINISSDAGVIDSNFDPDERDPIILPPPYFPSLDLKEKVNSNGTTSKYYDGTIDDYLGDVADNNTWSDVNTYLNTGTNTTTLTQTDTGLDVGTVSDAPYPDTNIDTPTDVLTGIGTIGGLIQAIINWLSQIVNSISNIFTIPADLSLNFEPLRLVNFKDKFPFSIPWDLYNSIAVFSKVPVEPNLTIDIENNYFTIHHVLDLSLIQFPLSFFRYSAVVFFVVFLITKTRDLIKW